MTTAMIKLTTFFVSNMKERMIETAYLKPLYIWSVGVRTYVKDVMNAESVIPEKFTDFVRVLEMYCKTFEELKEAVDNGSDNIFDEEIMVIGSLRRNLSCQYKVLMNARQTLSAAYDGIFTIPESLPGIASMSANMREFNKSTTEIEL